MEEAKSFQEQEMEKQKLLYEQNRLADRGAAETVLLYISASRGRRIDRFSSTVTRARSPGENNEILRQTLELGISLLHGGNREVQKVSRATRSWRQHRCASLENAELPEGNQRCGLFHFVGEINDQLQRTGPRHVRTLYQSRSARSVRQRMSIVRAGCHS